MSIDSKSPRRWLAAFYLKSDLSLVDGLDFIEKEFLGNQFSAKIKNNKNAAQDEETLYLELTFFADEISTAENLAMQHARFYVNLIVLTTNFSVEIKRRHFVIDWTLGLYMREALLYQYHYFGKQRKILDDGLVSSASLLSSYESKNSLEEALFWNSQAMQAVRWKRNFYAFGFVLKLFQLTTKIKKKFQINAKNVEGLLDVKNAVIYLSISHSIKI
jgi:hypothetical protein